MFKQPGGYFAPSTLGIALVKGVERLGLDLQKPHLRARMEADMKRIIDGQREREQVVTDTITQMRTIFLRLQQNIGRMDAAMAEFFAPAHRETRTVQRRFSACGRCGGLMDVAVTDGQIPDVRRRSLASIPL